MDHKQKLSAYLFFNKLFQAMVGLYAYGAV